jgi:hypothetical protein
MSGNVQEFSAPTDHLVHHAYADVTEQEAARVFTDEVTERDVRRQLLSRGRRN